MALMAASNSVLTASMVQLALLIYNRLAYSAISVHSLKYLAIRWSLISEGRWRRNMAKKTVQGLESVGSRVIICHIRSAGFMSPISGNFNNLNALVQRAFVYLDTSRAFSCS